MSLMITEEEHQERHAKLHLALDELIADWIAHGDGMPSTSTVYDLMQWSYKQVKEGPDHPVKS